MAENIIDNSASGVVPEQQTGAQEVTRQIGGWVRALIRRKAQKEHGQLLRQELKASRAKETAYRNMAQFAISFAAQEETVIPRQRFARRHQLANMWRNMQQKLAFKTNRGW